jgi:hypothetical protein
MSEKSFYFELEDEDSLILVDAEIDELPITLALDTGATHTVIDLTALLMAGYSVRDAKGTLPMETAKGVIDALVFEVQVFSALNKTIRVFEICSYDFLANSVLANIDGVLGLDFYRGGVLIIDFKQQEITLKK